MAELSDEMKLLDNLRLMAWDTMSRTGMYSADRARGGNASKRQLDAHRRMLLANAEAMLSAATAFRDRLLLDPEFKAIKPN